MVDLLIKGPEPAGEYLGKEAETALIRPSPYRLAEVHEDSWKELFLDTLPKTNLDPEALVKELARQGLKVKDQARIFSERTGKKIRSFYNYRKDAKISKSKSHLI